MTEPNEVNEQEEFSLSEQKEGQAQSAEYVLCRKLLLERAEEIASLKEANRLALVGWDGNVKALKAQLAEAQNIDKHGLYLGEVEKFSASSPIDKKE